MLYSPGPGIGGGGTSLVVLEMNMLLPLLAVTFESASIVFVILPSMGSFLLFVVACFSLSFSMPSLATTKVK